MSRQKIVNDIVIKKLPPKGNQRRADIDFTGLRMRPQMEQIVDYLAFGQERMTFPDRQAKFIRNHPFMTQLDFFEMQDDMKRAWEKQKTENEAREISEETKQTTAEIGVQTAPGAPQSAAPPPAPVTEVGTQTTGTGAQTTSSGTQTAGTSAQTTSSGTQTHKRYGTQHMDIIDENDEIKDNRRKRKIDKEQQIREQIQKHLGEDPGTIPFIQSAASSSQAHSSMFVAGPTISHDHRMRESRGMAYSTTPQTKFPATQATQSESTSSDVKMGPRGVRLRRTPQGDTDMTDESARQQAPPKHTEEPPQAKRRTAPNAPKMDQSYSAQIAPQPVPTPRPPRKGKKGSNKTNQSAETDQPPPKSTPTPNAPKMDNSSLAIETPIPPPPPRRKGKKGPSNNAPPEEPPPTKGKKGPSSDSHPEEPPKAKKKAAAPPADTDVPGKPNVSSSSGSKGKKDTKDTKADKGVKKKTKQDHGPDLDTSNDTGHYETKSKGYIVDQLSQRGYRGSLKTVAKKTKKELVEMLVKMPLPAK